MLMGSEINVFDSQETKPYKNDSSIAAMNELMNAYQTDDVQRYEHILSSNKDILEDPFIAENIDEVTRKMRMKAVLKLISPYTRFTLSFVATQLKVSVLEVQDIVGFLIVDKKVNGKIDQEKGLVEIESQTDTKRPEALKQWTTAANALWNTILSEGDGFKAGDVGMAGAAMGPGYRSPADAMALHRGNRRGGGFGRRGDHLPNRRALEQTVQSASSRRDLDSKSSVA